MTGERKKRCVKYEETLRVEELVGFSVPLILSTIKQDETILCDICF